MTAAFSFIDDGSTDHQSHSIRSCRPSSATQQSTSGIAKQSKYENYNAEIDDGLGWDDSPQAYCQSLSSLSTRMSNAMTVVDTSSTVEVLTSPALAHYRIDELTHVTLPPGAPASAQFVIRGKHGERVIVDQRRQDEGPQYTKADKTVLTSQDKIKTKKAKQPEKTPHQTLEPVMLSAATKWQDELWRSGQHPSQYSLHKHKRSSTGNRTEATKAEGDEAKLMESSAFSLTRHALVEGKKSRSASKASSSAFSLEKHATQNKQSSNSSSTFSITKHAFHQDAEDHNHHKYFSVKRPSTASKHSSSLNNWEAQSRTPKVPSPIIWFAGGPLQLPTRHSASINSSTRQRSTSSASKTHTHRVSRASRSNHRSSVSKPSSPPVSKYAHGNGLRPEQDWANNQHEWEQIARNTSTDQDLAWSGQAHRQMLDLGRPRNDHESVPLSQVRPDLFYKDWPPMQYQEELDHAKDITKLKTNRKTTRDRKQLAQSQSTAGNATEQRSKLPGTTLKETEHLNLPMDQRSGARHAYASYDLEATPEDLRILANYLTSVRPDIEDEWTTEVDEIATDLLYDDPGYRQRETARQAQDCRERRTNHGLDTMSLKTVQPGDSASQLSPNAIDEPKASQKQTDNIGGPVRKIKNQALYKDNTTSYRAPTVESDKFDQRSEPRAIKRNIVVSYRRGDTEKTTPSNPGSEKVDAYLLEADERSEWIRKTIDRAPNATITTYATLPRMEAEVDSLKSSSRRTRSSRRQSTSLRDPKLPAAKADDPKKDIVARWDVVEVFRHTSSQGTDSKTASKISKSQRSSHPLCDVVEVFEEASNRSEIPSDRHTVTEDLGKHRRDSARVMADVSWDMVEVLAPGERSTASWENRDGTVARTHDELEAEQTWAWREVDETGSKGQNTTSWGPAKSHNQYATGFTLPQAASKKSTWSRASHATQRTETPSRKVVGWDDGIKGEGNHNDHETLKRGWRSSGSGLSQDSKAMTQSPRKKVTSWDDGVVGPA